MDQYRCRYVPTGRLLVSHAVDMHGDQKAPLPNVSQEGFKKRRCGSLSLMTLNWHIPAYARKRERKSVRMPALHLLHSVEPIRESSQERTSVLRRTIASSNP